MKKAPSCRSCTALSILAGALSFMGQASAVTVVAEDFEGGTNVFGAPTYNYSQHYTLANGLTPGGGNAYGTGVSGFAVNTLTAAGSPFSLLIGGITAGEIDSGVVVYDLTAQFSTYLTQNDYGAVTVTYFDGANASIGTRTIGGQAFVLALGSGTGEPPESLAGAREWASDSATGVIPAGARTATVDYTATRLAGGAADGYVDNLSFTISPVPEPSAAVVIMLAGSVLSLRRRRVVS